MRNDGTSTTCAGRSLSSENGSSAASTPSTNSPPGTSTDVPAIPGRPAGSGAPEPSSGGPAHEVGFGVVGEGQRPVTGGGEPLCQFVGELGHRTASGWSVAESRAAYGPPCSAAVRTASAGLRPAATSSASAVTSGRRAAG